MVVTQMGPMVDRPCGKLLLSLILRFSRRCQLGPLKKDFVVVVGISTNIQVPLFQCPVFVRRILGAKGDETSIRKRNLLFVIIHRLAFEFPLNTPFDRARIPPSLL